MRVLCVPPETGKGVRPIALGHREQVQSAPKVRQTKPGGETDKLGGSEQVCQLPRLTLRCP